jgi:hypothetical protein
MLVSVTTTIKTRDGTAHVWWPAEAPFETVEEIFESLVRDGAIIVERLETRVVDGQRRITGRSKVIGTLQGIALIQPLHIILAEQA